MVDARSVTSNVELLASITSDFKANIQGVTENDNRAHGFHGVRKNCFKCLYLNARSLSHKMPELLTVVEALTPDVIGVTESWGNKDIEDQEFAVPGYDIFRADRMGGHRGGGVLLLVISGFNAVEVKLDNSFCDQIWCKIKIQNGEDFYVGVCYRSTNPLFSDGDNNNKLCKMTQEVQGRSLLLMGDFNYPDIDWSSLQGQSRDAQQFINFVEDNFWTPHVTEGTRNGALLDLDISTSTESKCNVKYRQGIQRLRHRTACC